MMYELPDPMGACPVCKRPWEQPDGTSATAVETEPTGETVEVDGETLPVVRALSLRCTFCGTEWRSE